jgi:hypothetical protein
MKPDDGRMTLDEIREAYYKYRIAWYLYRFPDASRKKAYKYARVAWARKIEKYGRRQIAGIAENGTPKKAGDA